MYKPIKDLLIELKKGQIIESFDSYGKNVKLNAREYYENTFDLVIMP